MSLRRLLLLSLFFHWRGNLAVLLGVAVGTAVLTGALIIGDSLRGSLRQRALDQLGWVDHALVAGRFFRAELGYELPAEQGEAAIFLQGTVRGQNGWAGKVLIAGVGEQFMMEPRVAITFFGSNNAEAVINQALADEIGAQPGQRIMLQVQKASAVPRETLLGRRSGSDVALKVDVTVREILPADRFMGRFSLHPSPSTPPTVFVPLRFLQEQLGLSGRANVIVARRPKEDLNLALRNGWALASEFPREGLTLDDWGLVLRDPENRTASLFAKVDRNQDAQLSKAEWRGQLAEAVVQAMDTKADGTLTREEVKAYFARRGYLSLESTQMILEPAVEKAALQGAKDLGLRTAPTLVYLANWIRAGEQRIPYSIVAALDPAQPAPLGPFLPPGVERLADDEIVLTDWGKLAAKTGDEIELTYFHPVEQGKLEERTAKFKLRGVVPLQGVAADPDLTPEFPGITDKLTIADWDPPFPYNNKRIKKADEDYWRDYRTTPKAYITLAAGQKLWGGRFGNLTSIRMSNGELDPHVIAQNAKAYRKKLLQYLNPEDGGFVFEDMRARALSASVGGTDFGFLFLGFSFFLIAAALLLVGLLVRLNLERRASELGLLLAAGYRGRTVRRLLVAEGAIVTAAGGLLGIAAAILYASLLLQYLRASWPGGLDRSFLQLHVTAGSLLVGWFAGLVVSVLTIAWAVRVLRQTPPRALLAGDISETPSSGRPRAGAGRIPRWLIIISALLAIVLILVGTQLRLPDLKAMTFFGGGALLLTAGLTGVWMWLKREPATSPRPSVAGLGTRNASRHPVRSLLTAGLLAAAAFLIVAVESFRRQPDRDFLDKNAGSGGFALVAESDLPVFDDLNDGPGRVELIDSLERAFRQKPTDVPPEKRLEQAKEVLKETKIYPLRLKGGDDASCLNLYQAAKPRMLGVPPALIERGGFQFAGILAETPEAKEKPWTLLDAPADGSQANPVPVFAEQNSVMWMLKSKLGGVLAVPREGGPPIHVRIVGLLQDNPFQSELWMSEANFLRLYPDHEGYNVFLIETPLTPTPLPWGERGRGEGAEAANLLETALADRGFDATPAAERVAAYQAVVNTYLSTFQALGGLGLLLGALGLAVVLLRSVWERRGELALLRALGFRRQVLGWLVLAENACLLVLGLGVGSLAALLAVAPHAAAGGQVPWLRLAGLLALVLVVGLGAGLAALAATLRAPLIPALRRE